MALSQHPQRIKKNPDVLVLSLLETVCQFLQDSWVGWKHNGIEIQNEFQSVENKRVGGFLMSYLSWMSRYDPPVK
jgi:hypothetical protein